MIRVIQLIQGKHFGGAEKVVLQLATHLLSPDFECIVICLSEGKLFTMLRQAGVKTYLVPMRNKLDFLVMRGLIAVFKRYPGAVVQSHTGRTNLLARLASVFVNIKKLVTLHSPILYDTNVNLRPKRLNAIIERLTAHWSDFFVTVSKEGYEHLLQQGIPPEKIMVIYNGIDCQQVTKLTPEEKLNLRQELGFSANEPIVAMVAQLR
ncbi:MAG: glycosyltransferase, partial [Candidatus Sumerlaeia bacterium]|nr:glycosyltransferase [Candidatus Sumerlaeia bacterium]